MFNKLSTKRYAARHTQHLSGIVNSDMIAKARGEIAELKLKLKRFNDPS
jgi:hypothetical protein